MINSRSFQGPSRSEVLSSLTIIDSTFNNTDVIRVYECVKATLTRSKFLKVESILIDVTDSLAIQHCQFRATGTSLREKPSPGRRISVAEAFISNSQFHMMVKSIYIAGFHTEPISKCVVLRSSRVSSPVIWYGSVDRSTSVELRGVNHIIVDELFCDRNIAAEGGCMKLKRFNILSMKNSVFKENKAKKKGGALFIVCDGKDEIHEVIFEIQNCTFVENKAQEGGAVYISQPTKRRFM